MAEAARRPSRGQRQDPFLEFPSEKDLVGDLARRLRSRTPDALAQSDLVPESRRLPASPVVTGTPPPARGRAVRILEPSPEPPKADPPPRPADEPESPVSERPRRSLVKVLGAVVAGLGAGLAAVAAVLTFEPNAAAGVPAAAVAGAAALEELGTATITSEPAGALVFEGDRQLGTTPLELSLPVGTHDVMIRNGDDQHVLSLGIDTKTVVAAHVVLATARPDAAAVEAAANRASTAGPVAGWLGLDVPIELTIREGGEVVGTTLADRVMLAAGRHALEFSSEALEYRAVVDVDVRPGRITPVTVPVPNGSLSVSAWPWAMVFVNGQEVGNTPVAGLRLPIGRHEVVWRHPELGERRETVIVGARTPARAGVDFHRR